MNKEKENKMLEKQTTKQVEKKNKKPVIKQKKKDGLGIPFSIGAVIGAVLFIALYGVHVLDFTNDSWLLTGQDLQQHYSGWMFFRNAKWQFPLGMHDGLTNPYSISILYTDSIPLFAIFFKAFSGMLPATFQYFGLFGIMCYILNGGFAAVIVAKFTRNKGLIAAASVFFIFATPVLQRMYGLTTETTRHTSLAAHFLILGALAIWIHKDRFQKMWKPALAYSLLGIGCVTIQMYIIFMVGGIMCGYLLHCLLIEKKWKRVFVVLGSFMISSMIVFYVVGGFSSGVDAGMGGFGEFSANINSLFNSYGYSSILPKFSMMKSQYEGVSYVGAGIILMACFCLYKLFEKAWHLYKEGTLKETVKAICKRKKNFLIPVIIVGAVFWGLAVSSQVYLGKHFIIGVQFPKKIEEMLGVFRSSGRFMWVIMYGVMIVVIALVIKLFNKKTAGWIIIGCLALQMVDLSGALRRVNNEFASPVKKNKIEKDMTDPFWNNIPDNYDKVLYFPMSGFTHDSVEQYLDVGVIAAKNKMTMNYSYLSRPYDKIIRKGNKQRKKEFDKGIVDENALYMLDIYFAHEYADQLNTYQINNSIVGTKTPLANVTPYTDVILSSKNRSYHLDFVKKPYKSIMPIKGWYEAGNEYTWTKEKGTLLLFTERVKKVHVKVEYVQNPQSGETKLYLNGNRVAEIPKNGNGVCEFDINIAELRGRSKEKIQSHILNIVTKEAATVKKNKKKMKQGIAIKSFQIDVADDSTK